MNTRKAGSFIEPTRRKSECAQSYGQMAIGVMIESRSPIPWTSKARIFVYKIKKELLVSNKKKEREEERKWKKKGLNLVFFLCCASSSLSVITVVPRLTSLAWFSQGPAQYLHWTIIQLAFITNVVMVHSLFQPTYSSTYSTTTWQVLLPRHWYTFFEVDVLLVAISSCFAW